MGGALFCFASLVHNEAGCRFAVMSVPVLYIMPPKGNYVAMAIWPVILHKRGRTITPETLNHELIHHAQQKELWLIGFYPLYLFYFLRNYWRLRDWSLAYSAIPFEVEAHANETNYKYLENRPRMAWRKRVRA